MSGDIPSIPMIPVHVRFPNRYTGGYDSSTATDKLKWATIASVKQSRLNRNSNMTGVSVIAKKAAVGCYDIIPIPVTLWVAGGNGANTLYNSRDGVVWSPCISTSPFEDEPFGGSGNCSVVQYNGNLWVAGGDGGQTLYHSSDGKNWTPGVSTRILDTNGIPFNNNACYALAYSKTLWVAGGKGPNNLYYSADGIKWTPGMLDISGITFNGGSCATLATNGTSWVAGGTDTSGTGITMFSSSNGISWSRCRSQSPYDFNNIPFYNGGCTILAVRDSLWVAGGISAINTMYYSQNGNVWYPCNSTVSTDQYANPFFNGYCRSLTVNKKRWVAGGSGLHAVYYSSDSINWFPAKSNRDVSGTIFRGGYCNVVACNNGIYIAGGKGNSYALYYSIDSVTWEPCVSQNPLDVSGIPFVDTSGTFCSTVAYNNGVWQAAGNGNSKLYHSYDGISWIPSSDAFAGGICKTLAYR